MLQLLENIFKDRSNRKPVLVTVVKHMDKRLYLRKGKKRMLEFRDSAITAYG